MSTPVVAPRGGVRLEQLRAGLTGENLFLVPGLDGDPQELAGLAGAFTGPQGVYAVAPLPAAAPDSTMEGAAARIVAAIRQVQPAGPYRLGGCSFGGLAALEAAQQLTAAGDTVDALFLIEAVFDERYWPRGIWTRALIRRTGRQLLRIVRMNPVAAAGEFRRRGGRLIQRFRRRDAGAPDLLAADDLDTTDSARSALAAIGGYRPAFYDGTLTLLASTMDRRFGCDTTRIWAGYAARLDVQRIDGDHLTVMHDAASAAAVANVLDHRLALARPDWTGLRPAPGFSRPMIVSTMRWFSAARLAQSLAEAGFVVSACVPGGHPVEAVEGLAGRHRLRRPRPAGSVLDAIRAERPDILLPDDERALALLRRAYARAADAETKALIARSLGDPAEWPVVASRGGVLAQARALGVPAPLTEVIPDLPALRRWTVTPERPVVLKTDGSWGGRGVAVVRNAAALIPAWRALSRPPSPARAVKRLLVNREPDALTAWIRGVRPAVNAQQWVDGRDAIATVACLHGKVLAMVSLEVVDTAEARGPAAIVRVIEHDGMAEAARRLVERFGLSGFCGMDFVVTRTGEARLIEVNPRVTPTCHLLVDGGRDTGRTLALFPARSAADADIADLPVRSPALVRRGHELTARGERRVNRAARRVVRKLAARRF